MGRFHSLDLNQCIGGLVRFLSKELNVGSVVLKSLSLPTKEREPKGVEATFKKKRRKLYLEICDNPWKYHGKIREFCHYGKVGTLVCAPNLQAVTNYLW